MCRPFDLRDGRLRRSVLAKTDLAAPCLSPTGTRLRAKARARRRRPAERHVTVDGTRICIGCATWRLGLSACAGLRSWASETYSRRHGKNGEQWRRRRVCCCNDCSVERQSGRGVPLLFAVVWFPLRRHPPTAPCVFQGVAPSGNAANDQHRGQPAPSWRYDPHVRVLLVRRNRHAVG